MRILVIEDDELIAQSLVKTLSDQHYTVDVANDGNAGWELASAFSYELILLDVVLPKLDGISLCRQMRQHGIKAPIILVTAQDSSTNKIIGLDAGADDYVTKPFDLQEVTARIRALLRRGSTILPPQLQWENLRLDPNICEVTYLGTILRLTPKEYSLLELFLRNPQRVFSSGAIIDHLWSFEETPGEDTVRAHLKGLRQKLRAGGVPNDPVETVYGIGYRLKGEEKEGEGKRGKGKGKKEKDKDKENQKDGSGTTGVSLQDAASEASRLHYERIAKITAGIWQRSQQTLSDRITVLEQATTALLQNTQDDSELITSAYQNAHKLAGSLGMFGFDFGSRLASEIEHLLEIGLSLNPEQRLHLSGLVVGLRQELQKAIISRLTPEPVAVDERPLLLIVGKDKLLVELVSLATNSGIKCQTVADSVRACEQIALSRPDVVVLEWQYHNNSDLSLLAQLNCVTPSIPVLVLADQDSLNNRIQVNRLGGRAFLHQPVEASAVIEMVTNLLQQSRNNTAKVLIVDDDTEVLTVLSRLLQPWGLEIATLNDPLKFWETLESKEPDLLILDVEMPQINGIELCQVLRNDPQHSGLPVLFLTARSDADTMRRVFAAGADDYVRKPIVEPELVTRILNRIERSRWLRNMAEIDPLTGLANRRKSTKEINKLIYQAERHHQPLCFGIIKPENLQQINNEFGHTIGDKVLSQCANVLEKTFKNEIICRWAGAELVICLYSMKLESALYLLSECIKNIIQQMSNYEDRLNVHFSLGVSEYPGDGKELKTLYFSAFEKRERFIDHGGTENTEEER
jgi:diguanylate cyclase (GGDEF)-like protein